MTPKNPMISNIPMTPKNPMISNIPMTPKKIIISPLNWGFGHAGRMIPLALELRKRGHEIIFCADRSVIPMLIHELPGTDYCEMPGRVSPVMPGIVITELPGIHIMYFRKMPQWLSILLHLPHIIAVSVSEHNALKNLVKKYEPDIIISDNRFGFRHKQIFSVYLTHQIRIPFPSPFRFIEPLGVWLHRKVIERFDLCLIPDFPGDLNLSGRLSHGVRLPRNTAWTGPLSRFNVTANTGPEPGINTPAHTGPESGFNAAARTRPESGFNAAGPLTPVVTAPSPAFTTPSPAIILSDPYRCLILSGPEPQRSILKEKVTSASTGMHIVVLEGKGEHNAIARSENVTVVSNPDTALMKAIITGSAAVISRSGYTTLMELVSLQKGAVIIPTPGQPEQEYLGEYFDKKRGFVTLDQNRITGPGGLASLLSQLNVFDLPVPSHPASDSAALKSHSPESPDDGHHGGNPPNPSHPASDSTSPEFPDAGLLLDAALGQLTQQKI